MGDPLTRRFVSSCPVCSAELAVSQLTCSKCETQVNATLAIPDFFKLPDDLQDFVMTFLRCRGNIREVEKELGISYPTVCKRLDLVNELLGNLPPSNVNRHEILEQLERGEITAKQAAQLLKGR